MVVLSASLVIALVVFANPFAQRLGIFVEEIGPGYARAVKDITAEDANPVGVAHGGCYFSLADTACGSAMASHGYYAVTVNASYNFLPLFTTTIPHSGPKKKPNP